MRNNQDGNTNECRNSLKTSATPGAALLAAPALSHAEITDMKSTTNDTREKSGLVKKGH